MSLCALFHDVGYLRRRGDRRHGHGAAPVRRTHDFYLAAAQRLDLQLARAYDYAGRHFGGQNLDLEAMQRNARHALIVVRSGQNERLRRVPPRSPAQ